MILSLFSPSLVFPAMLHADTKEMPAALVLLLLFLLDIIDCVVV